MILATEKILAELQAKADKMKEAVLTSESDWLTPGRVPGTIYYFAENGDDANDGLSEASPKKTLTALNAMTLTFGDVVLFRRGDLFRGHVETADGITYSAYGEGAKPTISSSPKNFADPALWEKSEFENVWRLTEPIKNVGIITFDHSGKLGDYGQTVGEKKIVGVGGFSGAKDLASDLEFYSDMVTEELWLYSEKNPGERWHSLEMGEAGNTFFVRSHNHVTIDNLHITMTGCHGVGGGNVTNLIVRNCVFDWLGGSILGGASSTTRFGNAVEIYGACDGYKVYNNWMYEIYDTGITHQFSTQPEVALNIHNDVDYYDNLIEYCFWSIEYYNYAVEGCERVTTNVHVHDNFCRFGGEGWGCHWRKWGAPMYHLGITKETMRNYVTENNIFDRCTGFLFTWAEHDCVLRNNTYVQPLGEKLARIGGEVKYFDETAEETLVRVGETNPTLIYINPIK